MRIPESPPRLCSAERSLTSLLVIEGKAWELADSELQDIKDARVGPDVLVKNARLVLGIIADVTDSEEFLLF